MHRYKLKQVEQGNNMGDVEFINKTKRTESPTEDIGVKFDKDNDSYVHVVKESDNYYEVSEAKCSEPNFDDINNVEEQIFVTQDIVNAEKDPIKRKHSDDTEEQKSEDICHESVEIKFQNTEFKTETLEIIGTENSSDKEIVIDNESKATETYNEKHSDDTEEQKSEDICHESVEIKIQNTEFKIETLEIIGTENSSDKEIVTDNESKATETHDEKNYIKVETTEIYDPKQNWKRKKSEALPPCMEPRVVIEDIMLIINKKSTQAFKCHTGNAELTKHNNGTFSYGTINDKILFKDANNCIETLTFSMNTIKVSKYIDTKCEISSISDPVSVQTGSVNISLTHNDAESSSKPLICDKTFGNETSLIQHIRKQPNCAYRTSDLNNSVFSCNYCSFKTSVKSRLTYHTTTKHPKRSFNCAHCDFVAIVKSRLIRHINAKHTKNIVFKCSYCSFNSYFKANLDKHINTKHTKNNVFNCSYCSYKTYVKYKLNEHVNAIHTKINVFKCSFCHYEVYNKYSLSKHVNAKHTKTNVFNCSFCNYKAYDKRCLKAHVNAKHTKVNVYTCSYCSFKSFQQFNLNVHVNTKHTKIQSFNCSFCNYKAYSERLLSRHININHTKVNVFICSYCNLKVYYKPTLIRHIKKKHSKNVKDSYFNFNTNT